MIFETLQHILTPAPKAVKAMGYVREAIAIEARFKRCQTAWEPHLAACLDYIITEAEQINPGSTIMILGSGALHDVPMDRLLSMGHHIQLVDIVHLAKIKKQYGNHPQVKMVEQDVTGLVRPLYEGKNLTAKNFMGRLPTLEPADLVISLNILSQLPINLKRFAESTHNSLPEDFDHGVMQAHLNLLNHISREILIISDLKRLYRTNKKILEQETALPSSILRELGPPIAQWDWPIAPRGEVDRKVAITHQVGCWNLRQ